MSDGDLLEFECVFTPLPNIRGQHTNSIHVAVLPRTKQPKLPRKLKKRLKRRRCYGIDIAVSECDSTAVWNHFAQWHQKVQDHG